MSNLSTILSETLAPVFLITGISSLIGSMANRYGRVIDRIRKLLREGSTLYNDDQYIITELQALRKRARILRYSLVLCVSSVFAVSATVFCLFFNIAFSVATAVAAESFFILAMINLMLALGLFMHEFLISLNAIEQDIKTRSKLKLPSE